MDREVVLVLVPVVVGLVLLLAVAYAIMRGQREEAEQRRGALRQWFGPEYDALSRDRGEKKASRELRRRVKRVRKLRLEPLSEGERSHYADAWEEIQRHFVDDPLDAVREADELVQKVMHARGYPVGDVDQRIRDVSVDHPNVVSNYRAARTLAQRAERGEASTEDLRTAVVHYRVLFSELLTDAGGPREPAPSGKERYA